MNIDELVNASDEDFEAMVLQAFKRRDTFPGWWRAVLRPEVIDDTERVIREALAVAEVQALEPDRYRWAEGFAKKLRSGALAEIRLARIVGTEA